MGTEVHLRPAFKICGVTSPADARLAAAVGAGYLGANLVPESPRRIDPERARSIADAVEIPIAIVVAGRSVGEVVRDAQAARARVIQLHGSEDEGFVETVRVAGPWEVWKAVRPRSADELLDAVRRFDGIVDLLLVDAWHPERLGGTGSLADWSAIAGVRDRIPGTMRFGLAGGLDPENVARAIRTIRPDLVDVSSGVESAPGKKDAELLEGFARGVRGEGPGAPEPVVTSDREE